MLLGPEKCGKSSLLDQWAPHLGHGVYSKVIRPHPFTRCINGSETIDREVEITVYSVDSNREDLYCWGISGYIIMFDVSDKDSFERAKQVWDRIQSYYPIALVGNKSDLKREISVAMGREYADENRMLYFETSIYDLDSINRVFMLMADQMNDQSQ